MTPESSSPSVEESVKLPSLTGPKSKTPGETDPNVQNRVSESQFVRLTLEWRKQQNLYIDAMIKAGRAKTGAQRYRQGARHFAAWVVRQGLSPEDVADHPDPALLLAEFEGALDKLELAAISHNVARLAAVELIKGLTEMNNDQADVDDGQGEYEDEQEAESPPVAPEAPPLKGKRGPATPNTQTVRIEVGGKQQRRSPQQPNGFARNPIHRVLPQATQQRIRVHKRTRDGKLSYINDYGLDEIGSTPMVKFIKENIDEQFGDPSGLTTYVAQEVGPNDQVIGVPVEMTIEAPPRGPQGDQPLDQARAALDLVSELRENESAKSNSMKEIIELAKQKALAQGNGMGDLMMPMMLMMMQNSMTPRQDDGAAVVKIIEKLRGPQVTDFTHHLPPPPPVMMSPPPPPVDTLGPVVQQLLAATLAPKPPERSTVDFLKEMAAIRELFRDPNGDALMREMVTELKAIRSAPPASATDMVNKFKEIKDVVQTLAPALNMGGLSTMLQGVLTPKLAGAIGDMLGGAISQARAAANPLKAQPVARPQPTAQAAQPPPIPEVAKPIINQLVAAKTEPEQVALTMQVLQAYWSDPLWQPLLTPTIEKVLAGDVGQAKAIIKELLQTFRPDLAVDAFIDKVASGLLSSVGQAASSVIPAQTPSTPVAAPEPAVAVVPEPVEAAPAPMPTPPPEEALPEAAPPPLAKAG